MTPDFIPPDIGIPLAVVLWVTWVRLKINDRREQKKAEKP